MFDKGICEKSSLTRNVSISTRKLEALLQHSRFLKQIIQYSDITPGTLNLVISEHGISKEFPCTYPMSTYPSSTAFWFAY
ncbi:hypothetical protein T05_12967 [Trichinella murrelli]|uniref:Uncharacterized protein n=1 Tax=Trichinella murrelli TaxID=144512 RepID=A0A0V0T8U9_9BILA|nr:hypothetical protein T05_12967 [Trichinella murrelli]